MANNQGKPLLEFRSPNKGPDVKGVVMTIVMNCGCGHFDPIVLLFSPGLPVSSFCPGCKTKFVLHHFHYDPEKTQTDIPNIGIYWEAPKIIEPTASDKKLIM